MTYVKRKTKIQKYQYNPWTNAKVESTPGKRMKTRRKEEKLSSEEESRKSRSETARASDNNSAPTRATLS